ncbi:protein unc-93 homolog A-like [Ptychodera flava]|uniref:protein unc-93 homolog A-like n=1 Tax=Ptychodera flava TaxID=63121 RepID=UPI00396A5AE6
MLLLLLLPCCAGLEGAFFSGNFPKSYVSCIIGVDMVGYVMSASGFSSLFGFCLLNITAKRLGRVIPMIAALVIWLACYAMLLFWPPDSSGTKLVFLIAILWGLAESVLVTQYSSVFAIIFPKQQEAAFANLSRWSAVGYTVGFSTSLFMCVYAKIILLVTLLVVSWMLYLIMEVLNRHELYDQIKTSQPQEINNSREPEDKSTS